MKKISIIFLQVVIVIISIVAIWLLIWFPLTEGRATNLNLFSIYFDPFILYIYLMSIAFFMALFNAFKILGYIGQNKIFSAKSALAFKNIKYCAFLLGALIIGTGLYIKQFHHKDDDPAGFLALCMVATLITLIVATATIIFEKILHNAIDIKSENDLTV